MLKKRSTAARREARKRANARRLEKVELCPEKLRDWAEDKLIVPTGLRRGQKFEIEDWQMAFLRDLFAPDTREAGLSVARKNGKSGIIAVVCLGFLAGPFNFDGWRGLVGSLTANLSGELLKQIEQISEASGLTNVEILKTPKPGVARGRYGSELTFLSADKASGHASGADLALIDEGGLLQENKRELWDAFYSSTSGRDGKFASISIQGDGPMFAEMRDRANGKTVKFHEFAAGADDDMESEETWRKANPGLGTIKSLDYMRDAADRAISTPAALPSFMAHDLNLPQSPSAEMICTVTDWQKCLVGELPEKKGACYVGIDIGGAVSMSSVVAYWPETSRFEVYCALPAVPDLRSRGKNDVVGGLYERMHERGELYLTPGRVVDVGDFLQYAFAQINYPVYCAGADYYKRSEIMGAFEDAGTFPRMEWRGGKDQGLDVRSFQRAVMRGKIKSVLNLAMTMCLKNSEIRYDSANGNPKLVKIRQRGRIDAVSAGVIAVGLSEQYPVRSSGFRVLSVA